MISTRQIQNLVPRHNSRSRSARPRLMRKLRSAAAVG